MNYVILHTANRKLIVYITLKSLEEQLPAGLFIKVHKSFIVNRSKIKSIDGNMINTGIAKITISQNLREKVLNEILKDRMIKR
jgi:DNA-binding LytR/AlgR family response regulator